MILAVFIMANLAILAGRATAALLVLRHRKFRQYFSECFEKILALNIKSFQNLVTIFNISEKIVIKFCEKNENIGEDSICNFVK